MRQEGSALLETLLFGFFAALLATLVIVAIGRVTATAEEVSAAARTAVTVAARDGSADRARAVAEALAPDATIRTWVADGALTVEVVSEVGLLGPGGSLVAVPVRGSATAPFGPYVSAP